MPVRGLSEISHNEQFVLPTSRHPESMRKNRSFPEPVRVSKILIPCPPPKPRSLDIREVYHQSNSQSRQALNKDESENVIPQE
jgi:hypothetical protein